MSFSAQLTVEGRKYTVRSFSWSIDQNTDVVGRPDARVQGGTLQVEIDSEPEGPLHEWAQNDTKKISGSITVDHAHVFTTRKVIAFTGAFCTGLAKDFDGSSSSQNMTMSLSLSADKLTVGTVNIDNHWPV